MKGLIHCILALVLFSLTATAQSRNYQQSIRSATDSIRAYLQRSHAPGLSITVSVANTVAWSQGFGWADVEQQVPVNPAQTKFRIASISKPLTTTALALLVEQGKIHLDSSIYYYVPTFPPKKYRPTLRQLAGHLGGIRWYRDNEMLSAKRYPTVLDGLVIFQNDSLLSQPGTVYQYSSYGFNLLSAAMEKASGKDFITLMNDLVIGPQHLTSTTLDFSDSLIRHRSRFYEYHDGRLFNAPYVDNSYKWAGGGFLSTSEDLIRFAGIYLRAGTLQKETVEEFLSSQTLTNGKQTGYGMGWNSAVDQQGRFWFGHSGGAIGGTSDLVIFPKEQVAVVILTNLTGANIGELTRHLAALFMR